ncbi:MAG: KOW domain-containing RNA-binding protein [Symbiobacteriia bacterium]
MAQTAPFKSGERVKVLHGAYAGDTGTVWKALPDFTLLHVDRKGEGMVRIRTENVAALAAPATEPQASH